MIALLAHVQYVSRFYVFENLDFRESGFSRIWIFKILYFQDFIFSRFYIFKILCSAIHDSAMFLQLQPLLAGTEGVKQW